MEPTPPTPGPRRLALLALGGACVAAGAVGAVVPGLPTTVFLLVASWALARSSPRLAARLDRSRLAAPLARYRQTGGMPRRAKRLALAGMWAGIAVASASLAGMPAVAGLVVASGLAGSWVIVARVRTVEAPR